MNIWWKCDFCHFQPPLGPKRPSTILGVQITMIFKSLRLLGGHPLQTFEKIKMLKKTKEKMILEIFASKGLRFEQFHLKVGQNRVFGDFGDFGPKRVFGGQGATPQEVENSKNRISTKYS